MNIKALKMNEIWTPTENVEENRLNIKIQTTKFDISRLYNELERHHRESFNAKKEFAVISKAVSNLKSNKIGIVSLQEFKAMSTVLPKIAASDISSRNSAEKIIKIIKKLEERIAKYEEEMLKIKKAFEFKVLEFKKREY